VLERLLQVNLNEGKEEDENIDIDVDVETDWKRIKQSETQTTIQIIIKKEERKPDRQCVYNVTLRCIHAFIVAEGKKYYIF
jgi:hypothetical protein